MHRNVHRRLHQLIMALSVAVTIGCIAMVVGPWLNDRTIDSNPGRALATVQAVTLTRTTVEFQDQKGFSHSPRSGLLYPTGLGVGQRVWVNYALDNPELVKVEGRSWTLSVIPALSVWVSCAAVLAALWWTTSWHRQRQAAQASQAASESEQGSQERT
ncbi:DUF3592 domain-containing protein [Corynebacterium kozikiae]|uniref:DUF3592 domain-containing protein n=1 Tax=Corynebacterium kozikiae TaxID=2968469 RepID=UPI00211CDFF7|nr:DUF3592 domain-containing protein [Corynebacterium sp. 76QC2CO]MCQ9342635.1 hypothetical protein [Corynebacterium sp. 76QC2CO]